MTINEMLEAAYNERIIELEAQLAECQEARNAHLIERIEARAQVAAMKAKVNEARSKIVREDGWNVLRYPQPRLDAIRDAGEVKK